jgi:hypothetical protein
MNETDYKVDIASVLVQYGCDDATELAELYEDAKQAASQYAAALTRAEEKIKALKRRIKLQDAILARLLGVEEGSNE